MNLPVENTSIRFLDFGFGRDVVAARNFSVLPVDPEVQGELSEMALTTNKEAIRRAQILGTVPFYDPSEKHSPGDYVQQDLHSGGGSLVRDLHTASNLPSDTEGLQELENVFSYFARFEDSESNRMTFIKRASQFKSLRNRKLLESNLTDTRLIGDQLKLVSTPVVALDSDFDLVVKDSTIHILSPSSFESIARMREEILKAVPANIGIVSKDIPFVRWGTIEQYTKSRPKAARFLASIKSQGFSEGVSKAALKRACERFGVALSDECGQIEVDPASIMDFLGVLDRRIFEIELVEGDPEFYKAPSRSPFVGSS